MCVYVCVSMCTYMRVCKCDREREERENVHRYTLQKEGITSLKAGYIYNCEFPECGQGLGLCSGGMGIELRSLVRTVNINS